MTPDQHERLLNWTRAMRLEGRLHSVHDAAADATKALGFNVGMEQMKAAWQLAMGQARKERTR